MGGAEAAARGDDLDRQAGVGEQVDPQQRYSAATARWARTGRAVGSAGAGDGQLAGIPAITGADDPDERRKDLTAVAAKYPGREVPAVLAPGEIGNGRHILARGASHLPYARPRFTSRA